MDFYRISRADPDKKGVVHIYPDYTPNGFSDLMIRGGSFHAIWDEKNKVWSTNEYDAARLVDEDLKEFIKVLPPLEAGKYSTKFMTSFASGSWVKFKQFVNSVSDRHYPLDRKLRFLGDQLEKEDYATKTLPYRLEEGSHDSWDELLDTLYTPLERQKIEWAIGSIVSGESRFIQKFLVFYGSAGTGKSTILNIIEKLFTGYVSTFDAKSLGSNAGTFATEAFKHNPLVAIQHDGDLSRIEDNTRLNSIVAHEEIMINEKFKSAYPMAVDSFIFMGTNKPVKITDSRSGLVRRLIDVHPTGNKINPERYEQIMNQINFELGAIAHRCLDVFNSLGKNYYNAYIPVEMMAQTDYFYNFIQASYDLFEEQGGVTAAHAWTLFKKFCEEQQIEARMPQFKFREELKNYFSDYEPRAKVENEWVFSWYSGFDIKRFVQHDMLLDGSKTVTFNETTSILDEVLEALPAQYSRKDEAGNDVPTKKWDEVTNTLRELDTKLTHYVKMPINHILLDFDLTDNTGEKSLSMNLKEASNYPVTYGELSKSENGVHLHYLYDGDVDELLREIKPGVEIKVFKGNSSLRRKLTKCNNAPIATISNLPVKEKNNVMQTENAVKSEQGLRKLITRCLLKEIHPGTKSNVDFIKHVLDESYNDGLQYDVTDMKNDIIDFAMSSTNQSERALETVTRMKFASDSLEEIGITGEDSIPETVFDLEVYPNLVAVGYKHVGKDMPVVRLVNPTPDDIKKLIQHRLIGFNNRKYDNHILYAIMQGYPLSAVYELSQKMINNVPNATFGMAYNLSYTDVFDYAKEKMTLKKWQIKLGITHKEMDIPWDEPVPEDRIEDVLEYMDNDVLATEALHLHLKGDFTARLILAQLSGLTPNHTTNQHTTNIMFGKNRRPQTDFKYTKLSEMFPGYKFDLGKSYYRDEIAGEGGYVYAEPGVYDDVALLDVASMHPTSIEKLNLFGDNYTAKFSELKAARIAIKRNDFETASVMMDGKLKPFLEDDSISKKDMQEALKIAINSVYGLTNARFDNPFKDPRNKDNIVAKRGALFMIDLKYAVQEQGFTVAHIKTDSIKIPNATPEIIQFVFDFGQKYGYDFEHEATYRKFALVNDAVYVAQTYQPDGSPGEWSATGAQFQHAYVFKKLFTNEDIVLEDLYESRSIQKGALYLGEDINTAKFVGKTGQFIPVLNGGQGLYRYVDEKMHSVSGTKGYSWKEARAVNDINAVDMSYYEKLADKAIKTIENFTPEGVSFSDYIS